MIKLRRDFSNASKQKLLGMVADVEKEKFSNFTDWIGDSYYTFQSWIGQLNIRNYMNDVDSYHKKVIDKNNASKNAIDKIFRNVAGVDSTYQVRLSIIKANLQRLDRYIVLMENTVNPGYGNFTTAFIDSKFDKDAAITGVIYQHTPVMSSGKITVLWNYLGQTSKILRGGSKILSFLGKKDKDASLIASFMSYFSALCGCSIADTTSASNIVSKFANLFKASGKMELGLYKYYEKKLPIFKYAKLDKKFGKPMTWLTIATKFASAVEEGVDTFKIFTDDNSTAFDKSSQVIKMGGAIFDFGAGSYTAALSSQKYLRVVDTISGSKTAVNQILVDSRKVKYTTSAAATKKIAKACTVVALTDVGVSTIASLVKRYGQVSEDGSIDMSDVGSIGVYSSLSGINKVTSSLTLGIVHFDSESVASDLESDVSEFYKNNGWAAREIKNQLQKGHWYNKAAAFALSTGEGAVLVGKKTVEGVEEVGKTVGNWVSTGWNYVATNWLT